MQVFKIIIGFVLVFAVTFVLTALTTYFYNILIHQSKIVNWETSVRLAILFAIIFTWLDVKRLQYHKKEK